MSGFIKLFVKRFTLETQKLCEEMNLVQMRYMGSPKAYVSDFNAQMMATSKMSKFLRNALL